MQEKPMPANFAEMHKLRFKNKRMQQRDERHNGFDEQTHTCTINAGHLVTNGKKSNSRQFLMFKKLAKMKVNLARKQIF